MKKIKISLLPIAMAILLSLSGCGMTDAPVEPMRSETITPYYFNLDHGHQYTYMVEDERFSATPYKLSMEMEGRYKDNYGNLPMYECDWYSTAVQSPGGYYHGYYAKDETMAYYVGSNPQPETFVWLDLMAPIEKGFKWSFPYGIDENNTINAEITGTGLTASMKDSTGAQVKYTDVIEVKYINPTEQDTVIKWFCKDHAMLAEWKHNKDGKLVHKKTLWKYEFKTD